MALILSLGGSTPTVASDVFLAPTAVLVGNVTVESGASIWFGAVLRGDHPEHGIHVGGGTNIQDNCVIHVGDWQPTRVGREVTVGHGAKFESCTIEDGCVVGMNAVILQEALIGAGSLVAANCVVLEGTRVPPGSLVAGVPGRVKRTVEGSAAEFTHRSSRHYRELAEAYSEHVTEADNLAQHWPGFPRCPRCERPLSETEVREGCPACG